MTDLASSPLGHATTYADAYDPALLFPVERAPQREELGLGAALPFRGRDVWTAYELSWLDPAGKPQVAVATFVVPAESPAIVESKSVKLYLTAFNQSRFADPDGGRRGDRAPTSRRRPARRSSVVLTLPADFGNAGHAELDGESIDDLAARGRRRRAGPGSVVRAAGIGAQRDADHAASSAPCAR